MGAPEEEQLILLESGNDPRRLLGRSSCVSFEGPTINMTPPVPMCLLISGWIPQESYSEMEIWVKKILRECPWDQFLRERKGNRIGQREKLGFNAVDPGLRQSPIWSYDGPSEMCQTEGQPVYVPIHKSLGAGCPWTGGVTVVEAAAGNSQGGAQFRAISLQHPQKLGQ